MTTDTFQTWSWWRRRQQLSRGLRRRRLLLLIGATLAGMLWGTCLLLVLGQIAAPHISFSDLSWQVGVALGVAVSVAVTVTRILLREVRIKLTAAHSGYLVATLLCVGFAASAITSSPAAAQSSDCDAMVRGDGISGSIVMSATSRQDPLEVVADESGVFVVVWQVEGGTTQDTKMRIWTDVVGRELTVFDGESNQEQGNYVLKNVTADVAVGLYEVHGALFSDEGELVCEAKGYVHVLGTPVANGPGILTVLGFLAGGAGLFLAARLPWLDVWSATAPDRVSIEVINPAGKRARGPLKHNEVYRAKVSVEFPDPVSAYQSVHPVDVAVGVLGSSAAVGMSSLSPATNNSTEVAFRTPNATDGPLRLNVNLSTAGNMIQSIRLEESLSPDAGRTGISEAVGQVIYRLGDFTARHLDTCRSVDATVMLHGDGDHMEIWSYRGDVAETTKSYVHRARVSLAEMERLAGLYRRELTRAVMPTSDGQVALARLAKVGSRLRQTLLTGVDNGIDLTSDTHIAPIDGRVLVVHDTETMESMTFPWTGLYEGPAPADPLNVKMCTACKPNRLLPEHASDEVCPYLLWGLRYELSWPNGWVPVKTRREHPGFWLARRVLYAASRKARMRAFTPNRLQNSVPVNLVAAVAPEFVHDADVQSHRKNQAVNVLEINRFKEISPTSKAAITNADILYFVGHGSHSNDGAVQVFEDGTIDLNEKKSFRLVFDEDTIVDDQMMSEIVGGELTKGPLAVLNACESGVVGLNHRVGLLEQLRKLGVRGVLIAESKIPPSTAMAAVDRYLEEILAGQWASRAALNVRRWGYLEEGSVTLIAFSYYGPPGLRLTQPVGVAQDLKSTTELVKA